MSDDGSADPETGGLSKSNPGGLSRSTGKLLAGVRTGMQVGSAVGGVFRRASMRLSPLRTDRSGSTSTDDHPPRFFSLFNPPRQMQHWGQPQVHPHTNWFDLFFDLVFVGAAFQLGTLLKATVSAEGALYFASIFLSLHMAWSNKLHYDACIDADDLAHKTLDMVEALLVCAAALHIGSGSARHTPVQDIQDRATGHAWGFSLCHCALRLLDCVRWHEVFRARETSGSIHTARIQIKQKLETALLYFGAAVLSNSDWTSPGLASRNGACLVWLAAALFEQHSRTRRVFGWCGATAVPRDKRIPMHIIYSLHRYGEWIMLTIGESMLSLVVGVRLADTPSVYVVFACGFFSAAALQFLHYSTQPFEPAEHAMRRHAKAGLLWGQGLAYYSAALIAFGVAIKVLLAYHDKPYLARKYAWLSCGSLALSFLLMQWMKALHGGVDQLVVDCGLHAALPPWLFDTGAPHRGGEGARSARQIAAEELDDDVCLRRRRLIALAKLLLLAGLAALPLADLRALYLSVALALWCAAVVVLEALTRSRATASHDAVARHSRVRAATEAAAMAAWAGGAAAAGGAGHHADESGGGGCGGDDAVAMVSVVVSNDRGLQLGATHNPVSAGGASTDLATTGNTSTV